KSERDKCGLIERKNVERLKKAEEKAKIFNQKVAVLFNQVSNRMKDLKDHYNKILENEAIEIYKNNFGNMLNWESYRKKAGIKFIKDTEINALENVFRYVYSDTEMFSRSLIVGKTMEELKVFWNSLALKRESSREHIYWKSSYYEKLEFPERFLVLDKSFVLFPLPTETEAEKKEEG
ncbi:MAG TPA: hypothetical protein PKY82_35390, partial [Pyrinomonadaceae bacterium]|nr:hypothetical protein [Pyrinomonadaceae bacterium]